MKRNAVNYFKSLKKKYGAKKKRKTEIRTFENIVATKVVVANQKLYVNRDEGFAGFGMKKDEFVADCSDIDNIIVFTRDGTMMVSKIQNKAFFGKNIIHINVWKKGDTRTVYNAIYQDGRKGKVMVKRFCVNSITRDKEYDITKGNPGSKILYFTANPNGEAELVNVILKPIPGIKKFNFDYDQLSRVCFNLIKNSIESIKEKTKKTPNLVKNIDIEINELNDYISLTIIDSGLGFKNIKTSELIKPYFTTKADGTGLGLSIVSKIINDHNGVISFHNLTYGAKVEIKFFK